MPQRKLTLNDPSRLPYKCRPPCDAAFSTERHLRQHISMVVACREREMEVIRQLFQQSKVAEGVVENVESFPGANTDCEELDTNDNIKMDFGGDLCGH